MNKNITDFPFSDFSELTEVTDLVEMASQHKLPMHTNWLMPQALALIGSLQLRVNDEGLYCPKTLLIEHFSTPYMKGIWRIFRNLPRSSLIKPQNTIEGANYCALVPLIMSAFKKYKGIPYKSWDPKLIHHITDPSLCDAMRYVPPNLTNDDLMEIRTLGLTIKSGARGGQVQSPTATWCLRGINTTILADAPKLAHAMLTQIWVGHPSLRNQYMVLDPLDWDNMPAPLLGDAVLTKSKSDRHISVDKNKYDLPWL